LCFVALFFGGEIGDDGIDNISRAGREIYKSLIRSEVGERALEGDAETNNSFKRKEESAPDELL